MTLLKTRLRKRLRLGHTPSELDPDLNARETRFRVPPITAGLLATIRRISPQFHLRADERSRRFWELNQNGACWGEYLAVAPYLTALEPPARVLEIGPGLGRSAVFFKRLEGWERARIDLYEGDGDATKYTRAGARFVDSFCGDLEALRGILEFNDVDGVEIFDARALDCRLSRLPGPYDFVYSFFAIGFHWSIEHFLDEILGLMHDRSLGVFTLHDDFRDLSVVRELPHRVVTADASWPRGGSSRLLVLAKSEETLLAPSSRPRD